MLIVTISRTNRHFSLVDAKSRSQLHMAGAFITFSDCLVVFFCSGTSVVLFHTLEISRCHNTLGVVEW